MSGFGGVCGEDRGGGEEQHQQQALGQVRLPSTAPGVRGTRAGVTNRFPSAEAHVARKRGYQVRGK